MDGKERCVEASDGGGRERRHGHGFFVEQVLPSTNTLTDGWLAFLPLPLSLPLPQPLPLLLPQILPLPLPTSCSGTASPAPWSRPPTCRAW